MNSTDNTKQIPPIFACPYEPDSRKISIQCRGTASNNLTTRLTQSQSSISISYLLTKILDLIVYRSREQQCTQLRRSLTGVYNNQNLPLNEHYKIGKVYAYGGLHKVLTVSNCFVSKNQFCNVPLNETAILSKQEPRFLLRLAGRSIARLSCKLVLCVPPGTLSLNTGPKRVDYREAFFTNTGHDCLVKKAQITDPKAWT